MSARPEFFSQGEKARLIPIAAESSKEIRAVSVFLAVMTAVPGFAELMLRSIHQKVGKRAKISCLTEVAFKQTPDGKQWRPDGFMLINSGGGREWSALIEAKTGRAEIDVEQARQYATLAKAHGINSLITISNQFAALPTHSPVTLEKVTSRHVDVFHWSWTFIMTQAMLLINGHGLDTVEQKLILSELVRYFSHDSAGVIRFDRMNKEWKDIVLAVNARQALLKTSREVENTVAAWYQECRDICLLMTRKLNRQVVEKIPRAYLDDASLRLKDGAERLSTHNVLECYLEVPDAASPIHLEADLMRRCLAVSMTLAAPKDVKRAKSRVNWLVRQLQKSNPETVSIEAVWPGRAPRTRAMLEALREEPECLVADNHKLVPTSFTVMMVRDIAGRFSGSRTFIEELEKIIAEFYENVGQHLEPYRPKPPQVKAEDEASDSDRESAERESSEVAQAAQESADEALGAALTRGSMETNS